MAEPTGTDDQWLLIRDYYGDWEHGPIGRYRLSTLDRAVRREGLLAIFDILGARTFRERLIATRVLAEMLTYCEEAETPPDAWFRRVSAHASALADLAGQYPGTFGLYVLQHTDDDSREIMMSTSAGEVVHGADLPRAVKRLRTYADNADRFGRLNRLLDGQRRKGRRAQSRPLRMILELEPFYCMATGGRVGRTTDPDTGECGGPFVEFMVAFWRLAGVNYGRDAIGHHVRRFLEARRSGRISPAADWW